MKNNDEKIIECLKDLEAARLSRKSFWPYLIPFIGFFGFLYCLMISRDIGPLLAFIGATGYTGAMISSDIKSRDRQLDAITSLLTELTKESRTRKLVEAYRDSPREPDYQNS